MAIAFTDPSTVSKEFIMDQMQQVDSLSDDQKQRFVEVIKELRIFLDTAIRNKTRNIPDSRDHGQHHFYSIRALNNPRASVTSDNCQLVGEEFFGLNRFVDELLDVGDIQWWALYDRGRWGLDTRCHLGEHLECGYSWGNLKGAVIMVNGSPLSVDEIFSLHRTFVNRKNNGFSDKFNRNDVKKSLEDIASGSAISDDCLEVLEDLGLYDDGLTYNGRSLLLSQEAVQRHAFETNLEKVLDGDDLDFGPHGSSSEILAYLDDNNLLSLLHQDSLSVEQFDFLKSKENVFVKKFGFSYIQLAKFRKFDVDDVQPGVRVFAEKILPMVVKGSVDIDRFILDTYRDLHPQDFLDFMKSKVDNAIGNVSFKDFNSFLVDYKKTLLTYGLSDSEISDLCDSAVSLRVSSAISSSSLDDKYEVYVLDGNSFSLSDSQKSDLADMTLSLFRDSYSDVDDKKSFVQDYLRFCSPSGIVDLVFGDVSDFDSFSSRINSFGSLFDSDLYIPVLVEHLDSISTVDRWSSLLPYFSFVHSNNLLSSFKIHDFDFVDFLEDAFLSSYAHVSSYEDKLDCIFSHLDDMGKVFSSQDLSQILSNNFSIVSEVKDVFPSACDSLDDFLVNYDKLASFGISDRFDFSDLGLSFVKAECDSSSNKLDSLLSCVKKVKSQSSIYLDYSGLAMDYLSESVVGMSSSEALDFHLKFLGDIDQSFYSSLVNAGFGDSIKQYYDSLCKGKSLSEAFNICKPYLSHSFSHLRNFSLPDFFPNSVKNLGNLKDISFLSDMFPDSVDEIVESFPKFSQSSGSGITFVDLFSSLEDDQLDALKRYFSPNSQVSQDNGLLKISGVFDNSRFVQAALFCSYLNAKKAGSDVEFDPDKEYVHLISSNFSYKFGDSKPISNAEILYKLGQIQNSLPDDFSRQLEEMQKGNDLSSSLEAALRYKPVDRKKDLISPYIEKKLESYINNNNKINKKNNDYYSFLYKI